MIIVVDMPVEYDLSLAEAYELSNDEHSCVFVTIYSEDNNAEEVFETYSIALMNPWEMQEKRLVKFYSIKEEGFSIVTPIEYIKN